jgi:integrase
MTKSDLEQVPGGFRTRIRYGANQRKRFTIKLLDRTAAAKRETELRALAHMLTQAGHSAQAPVILRNAAEADAARFTEIKKLAEGLCAGRFVPKPKAMTVRELGELWTEGKLHDQYPDQVRVKATADDDESRLKRHVYPIIGPLSLTDVTLEDLERVMRELKRAPRRGEKADQRKGEPPALSGATRQQVARLLVRLFNLAVYPVKALERSPIPKGFVPKLKGTKARAMLYPAEERSLLERTAIPLERRLLWGMLAREGMRLGEALNLSLADLDLDRGAVRLDKNKTDDPRAWALDPSVAMALSVYLKTFRPKVITSDALFVDEQGKPFQREGLAEQLRLDLEATGLKAKRPELFESSEQRLRIRVHDLRGVFVTVNLANGKSEAWISDRTGHRSSQMINRYRRLARTFDELDAGELAPLDDALPELKAARASALLKPRVGHELGQNSGPSSASPAQLPRMIRGSTGTRTQDQRIKKRSSTHTSDQDSENFAGSETGEDEKEHGGPPSGPPSRDVHDDEQRERAPDSSPRRALAVALSDAIRAATVAGDLHAARVAHEALGRLLEESEPGAPEVADLNSERKRRGR